MGPSSINSANSNYTPEISAGQSKPAINTGTSEKIKADRKSALSPSVKNSEIEESRVRHAIDQANDKMKQAKTRCEFAYHEKSHRISIKVLNRETNEVIREIPPEESIKMIEKIWELAGLFVDESR